MRYGSQKAYAPAHYRRELAEAAGFHDAEASVVRRQLRLNIGAFTGLALSSSHASGVIERPRRRLGVSLLVEPGVFITAIPCTRG